MTVIVKEDELPRNEWKLARVVKAHKSSDGLVRKVTLQLGNPRLGEKGERLGKPTILDRPIQKLVVLIERRDPTSVSESL